MSLITEDKIIFCCSAAVPYTSMEGTKLYNDPNRELHEALFRSFIAFAVRRQQSHDISSLIRGVIGSDEPESELDIPPTVPPVEYKPLFTKEVLEDLKRNPLDPKVPYVIHLTSRHDFGPVVSHRYFVCPMNLEEDWVEISLMQWFGQGEPFKMKAEKWDVKCQDHGRFFRMTLRPNLVMRGAWPIARSTPVNEEENPVEDSAGEDGSGEEHVRDSPRESQVGESYPMKDPMGHGVLK